MILQFDSASVTTVGVLVGLMFALASIQSFALTTMGGGVAWVSAFFGVLILVAAVICFLAFWTAGQFFVEKAYVLLVFAGIWALMEGISDIVRGFVIRGLHEEVSGGTATEGSHT